MLVFNQIDQRYQHRSLFKDYSLTIAEPRVLISGPNGCGKTTLLLMAAGLVKPQHGKVTFNDQDVLAPGSKSQLGISASKVTLPEFLTVKELLAFHARQFSCRVNDDWLQAFRLEQYLFTKVADLSLGNYKKLSLMTAMMHKPELLLLDEPGNGLDDQARQVLEQLLADYPGQVIIASHDHLAEHDKRLRHIPLTQQQDQPL